jgi:hypothetical protein
VTLVLAIVGVLVVATVAHVAMSRLRLDLASVLLWLGLAEDRAASPPALRPVADRAQPSFGKSAVGGRLL